VIFFDRRRSAAHQLFWKGAGMSFINWVKSHFSHRGKAVSLYRSGMAKANKRNYVDAIADYSAAIRAPNIPIDVKAMALYNRALAYSAMHEDAKAAEDLAAVLEMPGLPINIKKEAQERRERIRRRDENTDSRWQRHGQA
jgi:tetratricopeptide (TPR) repeat protein